MSKNIKKSDFDKEYYDSLKIKDEIMKLKGNRTLYKFQKELGIQSLHNELREGDIKIETLYKIEKKFKEPTTKLLPKRKCYVCRSSKIESLPYSHKSSFGEYYSLCVNYFPKVFEPFLGIISPPNPKKDQIIKYYSHLDDEFIFVLKGEVKILFLPQIKDESIELKRGEGVLLPGASAAWVPHCIISNTPEDSTVLKVCNNMYGVPLQDTRMEYLGKAIKVQGDAGKRFPDIARIGSRIRALGSVYKMKAEDFKSTLGISEEVLVKWETGKVTKPVPNLLKLISFSRRINKEPKVFFEPIQIIRTKKEIARILNGKKSAELVDAFFEIGTGAHVERLRLQHERYVEPFFNRHGYMPWDFVEVTEGGSWDFFRHFKTPIGIFFCRLRHRKPEHMETCAHVVESEEFIYVLSGEVEAKLGEDTQHLHDGDSIYLDSTLKHSWRALKEDGALALFFLWDVGLYKDILDKLSKP